MDYKTMNYIAIAIITLLLYIIIVAVFAKTATRYAKTEYEYKISLFIIDNTLFVVYSPFWFRNIVYYEKLFMVVQDKISKQYIIGFDNVFFINRKDCDIFHISELQELNDSLFHVAKDL